MSSRLQAPFCICEESGALRPAVLELMHFVSGVDKHLLQRSRVRPSRANWLRAPWYRFKRGGGAITVGKTMFFTRNYFTCPEDAPVSWRHKARGDESAESVYRWLRLLSHEVGHLAQSEEYGLHLTGKVRYVSIFFFGYLIRTLLFRWPVHDGLAEEIVADKGCWVFDMLLSLTTADTHDGAHLVIRSVIDDDLQYLQKWMSENRENCQILQKQYEETHCAAYGTC